MTDEDTQTISSPVFSDGYERHNFTRQSGILPRESEIAPGFPEHPRHVNRISNPISPVNDSVVSQHKSIAIDRNSSRQPNPPTKLFAFPAFLIRIFDMC
jgi:hypothetical protein